MGRCHCRARPGLCPRRGFPSSDTTASTSQRTGLSVGSEVSEQRARGSCPRTAVPLGTTQVGEGAAGLLLQGRLESGGEHAPAQASQQELGRAPTQADRLAKVLPFKCRMADKQCPSSINKVMADIPVAWTWGGALKAGEEGGWLDKAPLSRGACAPTCPRHLLPRGKESRDAAYFPREKRNPDFHGR